MLKIGDFSKLARISIRMLRHYDDIGLLRSARTDELTGYRYYSESQLPAAAQIASLREMGFGLAEIAEILQTCGDTEAFRMFLCEKRMQMQQEATEAMRRVRLIETAITELEKYEMMDYNVTVKELPERTVASMRSVLPTYECEGMMWKTLMEETSDIPTAAPFYVLAMFHDREYKENDVDVEVQRSVSGIYTDTEHVVFKTEPPVLVASAVFKGSYTQIGKSNAAVCDWIAENGYVLDGPMFIIYHVSPHETSNPDEFVTEVCFPIRKI